MRAIEHLGVVGLSFIVALYGPPASAQEPAAAPAAAAATSATFTSAQLEQMVAPIALYPDTLVTQILMASTYPLEIVEAARWQKANEKLTGKQLEDALKDHDWDISVKALVPIPEVLQQMNENLDWTQDLGDAFLAQKTDLLDSVQRMRGKAYEAGNLKTTEQQTVTQQPDKIIVIEQADPQVVYVPSYSPTVVYGAWSYPYWYYPPMYVPPPYGYGMMAFTAGVMWGAAWGGCAWGWGNSDIDIDIDRHNEFNRNTNINADRTNIQNKGGGKGSWKHNPEHRGGVNYRDNKTAQQFGAQGGSNRVTRDQARGYDRGGASASNRATGGAAASNRAAGGAGTRDVGASNRGASASQRGTSASQRPSASRGSSASSRNSAYSGSRNSSFDRSSSSRGSMSRSGGYSGGRSGGFSGGGRGGGGGRRR
jgi:hypothetical protein